MTQVAVGSTVLIHVPGSRSTEGQPVDIPAVVLSQDPEDRVLTLFAMHFEGQFIQRRKPDEVTVLLDAGKPNESSDSRAMFVGLIDAALVGLRNETRNEIETIQRQFAEFQEQILELVAGAGKPVEPAVIPDELPESGIEMQNARPRRR